MGPSFPGYAGALFHIRRRFLIRRLIEKCILPGKKHLNNAHRTVSVFSQNEFRFILPGISFFNFLVLVSLAIEKADQIRILFNRAGFAEIGEQGTVVRSCVRSAGKLGQSDNRHFQFSCQAL